MSAGPDASDAMLVRSLVDRVMANPATGKDIDDVRSQIGRYPRGMVAVGARCACGRPLAVVTRPLLPGGIPFPTTCYLTGPRAVRAVSHLEATGVMRELSEDVASDPALAQSYERAHLLYLAFRHELARRLGDDETRIASVSAGGMPTRVKCLHALVAQSLVMGPGTNPIGDLALRKMTHEFDPGVCRCEVGAVVGGR